MTSCSNNFNHFAENQLTKFSARDFSEVVGEQEMVANCGRSPARYGRLGRFAEKVSLLPSGIRRLSKLKPFPSDTRRQNLQLRPNV